MGRVRGDIPGARWETRQTESVKVCDTLGRVRQGSGGKRRGGQGREEQGVLGRGYQRGHLSDAAM